MILKETDPEMNSFDWFLSRWFNDSLVITKLIEPGKEAFVVTDTKTRRVESADGYLLVDRRIINLDPERKIVSGSSNTNNSRLCRPDIAKFLVIHPEFIPNIWPKKKRILFVGDPGENMIALYYFGHWKCRRTRQLSKGFKKTVIARTGSEYSE